MKVENAGYVPDIVLFRGDTNLGGGRVEKKGRMCILF